MEGAEGASQVCRLRGNAKSETGAGRELLTTCGRLWPAVDAKARAQELVLWQLPPALPGTNKKGEKDEVRERGRRESARGSGGGERVRAACKRVNAGKKRQEVGWARGRALNINPVSTSINNKVVCVCTVKQICISLYS